MQGNSILTVCNLIGKGRKTMKTDSKTNDIKWEINFRSVNISSAGKPQIESKANFDLFCCRQHNFMEFP